MSEQSQFLGKRCEVIFQTSNKTVDRRVGIVVKESVDYVVLGDSFYIPRFRIRRIELVKKESEDDDEGPDTE